MMRRLRASAAVALAAASAVLAAAGPSSAYNGSGDSGSASSPVTTASVTSITTAQAQARMASLLPRRVAGLPALDDAPGIYVADAASGSTAYSTAATVPMRGASTLKVLTAVSSLRLLGADHRFPTRVVTGRTPREVVIVGGGDPLLSSSQLGGLARRTAAALAGLAPPATGSPMPFGVSVRLDDTLYPAPTAAPGWRDTYQPYEVAPVRPLIRDLRNEWDVATSAATWFAGRLQAELVSALAGRPDLAPTTTYRGRLAAPAGAAELARFSGNSAGAILRYMLLWSDNDVAEMMHRNNAVAAGRSATWGGASQTALETLTALGISTTGWVVHDGSGLSRWDRLTARGLATVLRRAASPSYPALAPLRSYLPVGGVSGTLQRSYGRYDTAPTSCAAGRVWGKTGSLFDTISLAGYAMGADGALKVFSVLVHRTDYSWSGLAVRRSADRIAATATGCY